MVIKDHPDVPKGDKRYPGFFQKAMSEYLKNMTDDERETMEKTREDWQNDCPPMDIRLR